MHNPELTQDTDRPHAQAHSERRAAGARGEPSTAGDTGRHHGKAGARPDAGDTRIALHLLGARDHTERLRLVRGMLSVIGFSSLAYVSVQSPDRQAVRARAHHADLPLHFGGAYFEAGYAARDPRLTAVLASDAPLVWDRQWLLQAWRRDGSPGALRELFDALEADELHSGLVFGIPAVPAGVRTIISFGSRHLSRVWINDSVLVRALSVGIALHRAEADPASGSLPSIEPRDDLSDMQLRILACLAGGLSDKQIAQRLQTTSHNVDYHLRRLRRKYGAANRAQLAFLTSGTAIR